MTDAPQRPVTVLIAALGGEGGGVLSDWVIETARALDLPVQGTSIPGVAQRTGATTYYIELWPAPRASLGGAEPVFALTPFPGHVDLMVASELLEAGRAMQNGYVSPGRTTLVASTHRVYAIGERTAMGDGRFDGSRVIAAAREMAGRAILFDMERLARDSGTVISAVMFGAMAGSGVLPFPRAACEAAIRAGGKAVEANLRGFARAYDAASGNPVEDVAATPTLSIAETADERVRRVFPASAWDVIAAGAARVAAYQDPAYASLYLDRLEPVVAAERAVGGDGALTRETGRHLALWMSYEDVIRVAEVKTDPARLARVRAEVGAGPEEPVAVVEFLKPGIEEICAVLPTGLGRRVLGWARARGVVHRWNVGLHLRTTAISGYALLRVLARLKPWRRRSLRFAEEQALIERWLRAILEAAPRDPALAREIAECARLIKGYGDTYARGLGNFLKIFEELVEGPRGRAADAAASVARARAAALADPDGVALSDALASVSPPAPANAAGSALAAAGE